MRTEASIINGPDNVLLGRIRCKKYTKLLPLLIIAQQFVCGGSLTSGQLCKGSFQTVAHAAGSRYFIGAWNPTTTGAILIMIYLLFN